MFNFPSVFFLEYVPNENYLYKFKPAVLEAFSVDFSGSHPPAFLRSDAVTNNQNPPESVVINAQFLELELWIRENYYGTSEGPDDKWVTDMFNKLVNEEIRKKNAAQGKTEEPSKFTGLW